MRWVVLLVLLVGCTADSLWVGVAGEDSWTTPPGIPLQLRVSTFATNTITAVALPPTAPESPTGPAQAGTTLPVTLQGVACRVVVLGRTSETVEKSRPDTEVRRTTPAGTRTLRWLTVRVDCGDQPVPGTDASLGGSHSRHALGWAALVLAVGMLCGEFARRRHLGLTFAIGAVAFAGGAVLGFLLFDGLFAITYPILFLGLAFLGTIGMHGDELVFRLSIVVGAAIGVVIAALIWPLWNAFGPIMALIMGAVVAAIGATAVTLKS